MPSFQPTSVGRSMVGAEARMPSGESPACRHARSNSSAAWISAFDGMQPTLRQVPPRRSPSTSTVGMPSWPARIAAT